MNHNLEVTMDQRPEVVERVLRVVRHRGFTLTNMNMRLVDESVYLSLSVSSERGIELLSNQLTKLVDVTGCHVMQPAMPQSASA
ncbi:acetolactate synthase 2 small subunit [Shewanella litorisediminis]|uniref:Acetolactate synthase 2 small subunit n=1 Tax=Shewanella litorisediminis TaxID=1173586 RepID=A0ABX7G2M9_9GAMM|nr:acetolactate synthase 2 small subunit [Shewanella litorisediminis]MCL2917011.1 acetolactate synthase 2 small subunit [Shewanella litorisediminis]QRH01492.1 acetolactate synthase 2 small subunit [Shewanella litorisediminis]